MSTSPTNSRRRRAGRRPKLLTPKAYLGWGFMVLIPIALTQPPFGEETRVLGLAILGSVGADMVLALAIAFALDLVRQRVPDRSRERPWRGWSARRRPLRPFWPSGALLCGVIVGLLLDPTSSSPLALAAGAIGSVSKHAIRHRSRHIFNPAAFGLLAGSVLFTEQISWWGALPALPLLDTIAMLLAGAIVLDRSRKLPSALAFLVTYYTIFLFVALTDPHKATEAFRSPISNAVLFYAVFMISDPPTAPVGVRAQLAYGTLTGAVAAGLELTAHSQTFLITALIVGNLYAAAARALRTRNRGSRTAPRRHDAAATIYL